MNRISKIADFAAFASKYDYVSFDLFDTLIRRRFLGVHQVHDTASAYALALLGRHSPKAVSDMTALRYRMGGALKSAPGLSIQEPRIEQVWDRILAQHHEVNDAAHRAELVEKVVRFEHEIELINLTLIDGARDLLVKLRQAGKRLIAISDMYFSEVQMEQILERLGLLELFDHVYISAEENLTKQTGDLFLKVMDDLGIDPRQQIHVGDNLASDVEMANSVGLEAVLVEQHHLLKLETPKFGKRKAISQEVADLVKAHLFTVLIDVLNRRATQIYFMARDGIAIREFLAAWPSGLRDTFLPVPEHRELYLNRALTCWADIDFSGDWLVSAVGWAFWLKEGKATRTDIAELLGVPPVMPELGDTVLESAKYQVILAKAYKEAGLEEQVKAQIIAKRATVERYLQGVGFYDHAAVAISDVGYSGTVGRALNTLLVQRGAEGSSLLPPKGKLHLIASGANYFENKRFALPHCDFSDQAVIPLHAMPPTLTGSYAWLEYFFKHPTLLPITRLMEEDGQVVPELRERKAPLPVQPASEVQAFATDDPSDLILLWMAATDSYGDLAGPIVERFSNPDRDTLRQMRGEVYELDPINGTTRLAFLEMPGARPDTIEALARRKDYWIAGSLAASHYLESDHHPASNESDEGGETASQKPVRWWHRFTRKGRALAGPKAPKSFDVKFYRSFYPDAAELGGDDVLIAHFVRHGRKENRFGSAAAFRSHLEVEFGTLPADFDHEAYLHFNPDVAVSFGTPEKALDHYLRYGRNEGRQYRLPTADLENELSQLVFDGRITLQPEEQSQLGGAINLLDIYLARFGLKSGAWLHKIDPVEFAALNGHWSGPVQNRAEALVALCEDGLPLMPSLSLKDLYDADYVRAAYPELAALPDQELYRACLVRIRPTSEEGALAQIWNNTHFPAAFDWQAWQERHPKALSEATRSEVLRHFLAQRGADRIEFVTGDNAPELLEFLGNQALHSHGSPEDAIALFTEAMQRGGSVGWFEHLIAEICLARGEADQAIAHFRRGAASATPNRWSSLHAADLLLQKGSFTTALQVLEGARSLWQDVEPWRALRRRALAAQVSATLRKFAQDPTRTAVLDDLDEVMRRHASLLPADGGAIAATGPVLVITGRTMNVSARLPMPEGVTVKGLSVIDDRSFASLLLNHSALVLHEAPCTADILEAIAVARSLGRPVQCWLGDPASTGDLPIGELVSDDHGKEAGWLRRDHVWEMALVARYCDGIVTTMAGLQPALAHVARKVPVVLHCQPATRERDPGKPVRVIMLLTSSALDQADLVPAVMAINNVAATDPLAHFTVDAVVGQHKELAVPADRLRIVDRTPDLQELANAIGHCDLVVQIAALHEVEPYSAVDEAWQHGIAAAMFVCPAANEAAQSRFAATQAKQLVPAAELSGEALIAAMLNPPAPAATPGESAATMSAPQKPDRTGTGKPRVLFVNVWFPPQSIGGATKVLTDNVDYLLDHHADEFDLIAFASDEHNARCGELSLGQYRDVPVFRFATPQEDHIYWRPRLAMADANFAALLDRVKPDLVHFHCLQRLGAGLLEVCRLRNIPHLVTLHDGWWLSDYPFMTDPAGNYARAGRDIMGLRRNPAIGGLASTNRAAWVRQALAGATRRLAVSEQFAQVYRDCGIQCDVIENGSSRLPVVPRPAARGTVNLLHLGGLERHKGAYLIEAALKQQRLGQLHLTLVDLARDAAFKLDTQWGETRVSIIGRQPVDALAKLYARNHVLVATSTCEESFGLVTREALQQGLWIVAGNRGAMAAPVEDGVNGFVVDVADASQLTAVLQQIAADPGRFTQSPPRKEDLRTADDQSRDLVALYRSVLGKT